MTQYMAVAERCPLPAFIVAHDGSTVIYVNPAYRHMTGRNILDFQTATWPDLVIHPDDRSKVQIAWQTFIKDGILQPHWHRYVHANGTVYQGMTLVDQVQGNGYVGFVVLQCGKDDCPVRHLNDDLWKLWEITKHALHET